MTRPLRFYHGPKTRSSGVLVLLEELDVPYQRVVINHHVGENRQPAYLAINPMGKIPAIVHGDALVTEQIAIYTYLADSFPDRGLSPAWDHPDRGPFLRWMAFYAGCFEPAIVDRAQKREPGPQGMSPYGDWAATVDVLQSQLAKGPYMLGDTYYALDTLWGMALQWTTGFGLVEATPTLSAYIERVTSRSAFKRAFALDEELAATIANDAEA